MTRETPLPKPLEASVPSSRGTAYPGATEYLAVAEAEISRTPVHTGAVARVACPSLSFEWKSVS